jgi:hypothetical protein
MIELSDHDKRQRPPLLVVAGMARCGKKKMMKGVDIHWRTSRQRATGLTWKMKRECKTMQGESLPMSECTVHHLMADAETKGSGRR